MKLRLAQMWDHNGTNMEAIGFMYRTYKVLVSLDAKDDVVGELSHHGLDALFNPQTIHCTAFERAAGADHRIDHHHNEQEQ